MINHDLKIIFEVKFDKASQAHLRSAFSIVAAIAPPFLIGNYQTQSKAISNLIIFKFIDVFIYIYLDICLFDHNPFLIRNY